MTEDERWALRENFTPSCLLDTVKEVDTLRDYFNDRDGSRPPEMRETLLRLHALALEVVNRGHGVPQSTEREFKKKMN
jgi:hypothetical protein